MTISSRPFRDDADFLRLRALAVETYPITGPGWNWDIRRWDGARYYNVTPALDPSWLDTIRLWETDAGRLVGAVNADGPGMFYLQLHPDFREVEEEMIIWAEGALAAGERNGSGHEIQTEVYEYDRPRQRILQQRGFVCLPGSSVFRKLRLGAKALPVVNLEAGYRLRMIDPGDWQDCQRLADLLNAAFNRSFHAAGEFATFAKYASSVRADLHWVAEAPDGSFGAHVGIILDEANRRGLFEPVCTHPAHRRKGLAQNLMFEGLQRLRAAGAEEVTVETGDMLAANALYDTIGFTEVYLSHTWRKTIAPQITQPASAR
jgi:mycothiol synthase